MASDRKTLTQNQSRTTSNKNYQFSEQQLRIVKKVLQKVSNISNEEQDDDFAVSYTYLDNNQQKAFYQKLNRILAYNLTFNKRPGELGHTNGVLLNTNNDEDIELFVPGYLRMKVRNLKKVDISSQEIEVSALIEFSICYGRLPRLIVDYLKEKLVMRFSKKNSILLTQTESETYSVKIIEDDELQLITFTVRTTSLIFSFQPYFLYEKSDLDASIWLSPFEKINNLLTVSIEDLIVRYDDLLCEYAQFYTRKEFDLVEDYFKSLKGYKGEIRKLILKINLMNLQEPQEIVTDQIARASEGYNTTDSNTDLFKNANFKMKSILQDSLYEQYRRIVCLVQEIQEIQKDRSSAQNTQKIVKNELQIIAIKDVIREAYKKQCSANKYSYDTEHLSGQYEIVTSELNVQYSNLKYLSMTKKIQKDQNIKQEVEKVLGKFAMTAKNGITSSKVANLQNHNRKIVEQIVFSKKNTEKELESELHKLQRILPRKSTGNMFELQTLKQSDRRLNSSRPYSEHEQNHQIRRVDPIQESSSESSDPNAVSFEIDPQKQDRLVEKIGLEINKSRKNIRNFQYAHFHLPIYKHPFVPLAIVFVPLWIISFINLIIFFSPRNLNDRLANIATLLIAYVAYFPIFRQQIPQYRFLLLAEILTYLQILCSFLAVVHSLLDSDSEQRLKIGDQGATFWISFGITAFTIVLVIIGYMIHKACVQPSYRDVNYKKSRIGTGNLVHILWNNYECDLAFLKKSNIVLLQTLGSFEEFLKKNNEEYVMMRRSTK